MAEYKTQKMDDSNSESQKQSKGNDGPPPPSYDQATSLGLALNTNFISEGPISLQLNGHTFSRDFEVVDATGKTVFNIDSSAFSMSHKMNVIHSQSGSNMFTIIKKSFSMSWRYSAEMPGRPGETLFDTETSPGFFSSGTTYMTFLNAVNGQKENLEVELHMYTGPSVVKYRGKKIADIDRESFSMAPGYSINIHAPGVDPLIMVVLALVIDDRIRTKRRN